MSKSLPDELPSSRRVEDPRRIMYRVCTMSRVFRRANAEDRPSDQFKFFTLLTDFTYALYVDIYLPFPTLLAGPMLCADSMWGISLTLYTWVSLSKWQVAGQVNGTTSPRLSFYKPRCDVHPAGLGSCIAEHDSSEDFGFFFFSAWKWASRVWG